MVSFVQTSGVVLGSDYVGRAPGFGGSSHTQMDPIVCCFSCFILPHVVFFMVQWGGLFVPNLYSSAQKALLQDSSTWKTFFISAMLTWGEDFAALAGSK